MAAQLDLWVGSHLPTQAEIAAMRADRIDLASSYPRPKTVWPTGPQIEPYVAFDEAGPVNYPRPKAGEELGTRISGFSPPTRVTYKQPTTGSDLRYLERVAANPVVKRAVDFRMSAAFASPWTLKSRNSDPRYQALDDEIMRVVQAQIRDMKDGGMTPALQGLLRNGIEYGLTFGEIVYQPRRYGTGVQRIKSRPPTWVQVYADPADNLERFQWLSTGVWVQGPRLAKYVFAPYPYLRNGNLYGTSDLACIAHDVTVLELLEEYRVTGVHNTLVRNILHYYSKGESEESLKAKIAKIAGLDSGGILSIPKGTRVEGDDMVEFYPDELKVMDDRASSEALKTLPILLERLETRITRALGIPDDMGLSASAGGSLARAQVEQNVSLSRVRQDQDFLGIVFTEQLIPAMVRYNYPVLPDDYVLPEGTFQATSAGWQSDDADRVMVLADKGLISREHEQELLGVPAYTPAEAKAAQTEGWTIEDAYTIRALVEAGILSLEEAQRRLGLPLYTPAPGLPGGPPVPEPVDPTTFGDRALLVARAFGAAPPRRPRR